MDVGGAIFHKGGPELYKMLTKYEVWNSQESSLVPASSSCSDFSVYLIQTVKYETKKSFPPQAAFGENALSQLRNETRTVCKTMHT